MFCVVSFVNTGNSSGNIKSKKQETERVLSSTMWILDNSNNPKAMVEFSKDGIYKCHIDYGLKDEYVFSGTWKVDNDQIILCLYDKSTENIMSYNIKVLNINTYNLTILYGGIKSTYYSELMSEQTQTKYNAR